MRTKINDIIRRVKEEIIRRDKKVITYKPLISFYYSIEEEREDIKKISFLKEELLRVKIKAEKENNELRKLLN